MKQTASFHYYVSPSNTSPPAQIAATSLSPTEMGNASDKEIETFDISKVCLPAKAGRTRRDTYTIPQIRKIMEQADRYGIGTPDVGKEETGFFRKTMAITPKTKAAYCQVLADAYLRLAVEAFEKNDQTTLRILADLRVPFMTEKLMRFALEQASTGKAAGLRLAKAIVRSQDYNDDGFCGLAEAVRQQVTEVVQEYFSAKAAEGINRGCLDEALLAAVDEDDGGKSLKIILKNRPLEEVKALKDSAGNSLLMRALIAKNEDAARLLVPFSDLSYRNERRQTALDLARDFEVGGIVQLLEKGEEKSPRAGLSSGDVAAAKRGEYRPLLYDPSGRLYNAKDKNGRSLFSYVFSSPDLRTAYEWLSTKAGRIGVDFNQQDPSGDTPLHRLFQNEAAVTAEKKAEPYSFLLLREAVKAGEAGRVPRVNLELRNLAGETVILLAASAGDDLSVEYLLQKGAVATVADRSGGTVVGRVFRRYADFGQEKDLTTLKKTFRFILGNRLYTKEDEMLVFSGSEGTAKYERMRVALEAVKKELAAEILRNRYNLDRRYFLLDQRLEEVKALLELSKRPARASPRRR